jgi:hypothetical protein
MTTSMKCFIPLLLASALAASDERTDNFKSARYDPQRNQLIVEMTYRGTNPDHAFHLSWGECRPLGEKHGNWQVAVDVLDDQWNDAALREYSRTLRFDLSKLRCRPARVTLKTAPRFYYTLAIPANTSSSGGKQIIHTTKPPTCPTGLVHRGGSMCVPVTAQADRGTGVRGTRSLFPTEGPPHLTVRPGLEIAIFGNCGYDTRQDGAKPAGVAIQTFMNRNSRQAHRAYRASEPGGTGIATLAAALHTLQVSAVDAA